MRAIDEVLTADQRALISLINADARSAGLDVFLVGGAVRDWLLHARAVDDLDIVVAGDAGAFAEALAATHGGALERHDRFNTARWICQGVAIDLTMARVERYARPAALPEVAPAPIEIDLKRRDFAVNAIALRLSDGVLIDPYDGAGDIARRVLRALHADSFVDDPTRILRAARYASRLGFALDARTQIWLAPGLAQLRQLSGERIKYDLELCFQDANPAQALALLAEWGVFKALGIPMPKPVELRARFDRLQRVLQSGMIDSEALPIAADAVVSALGWGAITYNLGQLPATRWLELLPLEVPLRQAFSEQGVLSSLSPQLFMGKTSAQSDALKPFSPLTLLLGHLYDSHALKRHACLSEIKDWRWVRPATTGDDLMQRGLTPGPRYKLILDALRAAWLDGAVNSLEQERALLQTLLDGSSA